MRGLPSASCGVPSHVSHAAPRVVQAAIAARKEALAAEQVHVTAALESGRVSGIDPLERPDLSPRVKVGWRPAAQARRTAHNCVC